MPKAPAPPVKLNSKLKTGSIKPTYFLFVFQNLNSYLLHVQNINIIINIFSEKKLEYGTIA